jgi:adhesin transport system outer membrane protein
MTRTPPPVLALCLAWCLGVVSQPAAARCINEELPDGRSPLPASPPPADTGAGRATLKDLAQEAVRRSQAVGAATLLAEAAVNDVQEARAGRRPQALVTGSLAQARQSTPGYEPAQGRQSQADLVVGAPLYDAGRIGHLTHWRSHLAEAALLAQMSAQEQVVLQTVTLAIDRNRYRLQAQVYQQYARRMGCLVQALEQIVAADKGRTSELVQARKNQQQAELQQSQSQAAVRQVEARLRRFVGDLVPADQGISAQLITVPDLTEVLAGVTRASDILQIEAQAEAAESLSSVVAAGSKPQLNWQLTGARLNGLSQGSSWTAGVTYTLPLYSPGQAPASEAARKRAQALRLQLADALEARRSRTADVHDQAQSAFDRARKVSDVLRHSELVRNYTLQQWQQLGRRTLFDVMSAEGDHYALRVSYVNAISDGQLATALLHSLGTGVAGSLQ